MVEPGWWPLILEAAGHDPLRAQEIEAGVNSIWWQRYLAWHEANAKVSEERQDELSRR